MSRSYRFSLIPAGIIAALLGHAAALHAQFLKPPTFLIEPGVITVDAVSSPLNTGSSTGLNLRFLAVFPTSVRWMSLELGTSFAPLGLSNGRRAFNDPTFFYGPVAMLLPRDRTANWVELSLPVLGTYRLDDTGEEDRLYVNDLMVQGVVTVPFGQHLMADMGRFWSRLTVYAIIEQNLTPARNFVTRAVDRFSPTFLYGVSIPVAASSTPPGAP